MKRLLVVTAVIELGAGVALLCCPSAAVKLLLSSTLDTAAALTVFVRSRSASPCGQQLFFTQG